MNLKPVYIEATDIPDAWFQCVYNILDKGRKYIVEQGSFVGQTRLEFDAITVRIKNPYSDPWDTMLPQTPPYLNIPNPVAFGYVEQYIPYLMTSEKLEGEDYTYGERLCSAQDVGLKTSVYNDSNSSSTDYFYAFDDINQINHIIKLLKKTPNTNQAVLQIAQPNDCLLEDPPCLRSIHVKVIDGCLVFYPYFRSNDLWGGMPANLAGLAVLQKYMADEIGVPIGEMVYFSSGLHIYGYAEELARLRTGK